MGAVNAVEEHILATARAIHENAEEGGNYLGNLKFHNNRNYQWFL